MWARDSRRHSSRAGARTPHQGTGPVSTPCRSPPGRPISAGWLIQPRRASCVESSVLCFLGDFVCQENCIYFNQGFFSISSSSPETHVINKKKEGRRKEVKEGRRVEALETGWRLYNILLHILLFRDLILFLCVQTE